MTSPEPYAAVLIPALHEIQHKHGYLKREALEEYSRRADVPLHRIQEVASFFPHFKLTPPPKITMHTSRDSGVRHGRLACGYHSHSKRGQEP